jgi:hypothetical protein
VPHPEMPAWLPPAFTAPCRKPQADTLPDGKHHADLFPSTFCELHGLGGATMWEGLHGCS